LKSRVTWLIVLFLFIILPTLLLSAPTLTWSQRLGPRAGPNPLGNGCWGVYSASQLMPSCLAHRPTTSNPSPESHKRHSFDYTISLSQRMLSVVQGESATAELNVILNRGLSEMVMLAALSSPPGASVELTPNTGMPSYSSKITLTTSSLTASGNYTLEILGVSASGLVKSTTLSLTVMPGVHNVTVSHLQSPTTAVVGDLVLVNVTVANHGSFSETLDVQIQVNGTLTAEIGSVQVQRLGQAVVALGWNTTGYSPGAYSIIARVTLVKGEENLGNNSQVANIVLKSRPQTPSAQPVPTLPIRQSALIIAIAAVEATAATYLFVRSRRRHGKA
jgi:hypothetical protein